MKKIIGLMSWFLGFVLIQFGFRIDGLTSAAALFLGAFLLFCGWRYGFKDVTN